MTTKETSAPVLEATDLWKSFDAFTAVGGVSLSVHAGESLAIIGPNGAGKSTLFDLLTGRKLPDKGRVKLFGEDVTQAPPWQRVRRGLGRSFQVSSVFPSFTALENVQTGLLLRHRKAWHVLGRSSHAYRDEAVALLEQVGLATHLTKLASELSYGDQRTLELAVALSSDPKLLLLDEPTAGMGPSETDDCLHLIKAIAKAKDIPVVFVEHDMKVVFSVATRIIVLVAGKVLVDGTPEEVRTDERVKEAYFGEEL